MLHWIVCSLGHKKILVSVQQGDCGISNPRSVESTERILYCYEEKDCDAVASFAFFDSILFFSIAILRFCINDSRECEHVESAIGIDESSSMYNGVKVQ